MLGAWKALIGTFRPSQETIFLGKDFFKAQEYLDNDAIWSPSATFVIGIRKHLRRRHLPIR